jgi:hypothetical protein
MEHKKPPVKKIQPPLKKVQVPVKKTTKAEHKEKSLIIKIIPYVVAILVFIAISIIYFKPAVFDNQKLQQSDIVHYKASSQEVTKYRDDTGKEALWTNSMFGGMPAFQISVYFKGNILPAINNIFKIGLPHPANILFLLLIGFFILMLALRVDPWLSIVGAVAFAFSSYFFIFLGVGHNAKTIAIAYMPAVFAGLILTYRGKYILGGAITLLFMALEISANHIQMTYYLMIFLGIFAVAEFIVSLIKKQFIHFLKATGIVLVAGILSFGPSIGNLWTSYEYMGETIRGGTELSSDKENRTSGLDKDYITQWSYGKAETFSLMIPDVKGGANGSLGLNKEAVKSADKKYQTDENLNKSDQYWGDLPFTGGPAYAGALVVFLFVLGLFIVRGGIKWAILVSAVLFILLSWGHNLMGFTDFFLKYVPFYNNFRAVSSTLILVEFLMPILAMLAIKEIVEKPSLLKEKKWFFIISLALTAGLALIFIIMPKAFFNFLSNSEAAQFTKYQNNPQGPDQAAYIDGLKENLEAARIYIFRMSAWRSILFIVLGAGVIFLYSRMKKMSKYIVYAAIGLLVIIDIWTIDKRYLNDDNFTDAKTVDTPFIKSTADKIILNDKTLDYRVLSLATNNFTIDANPSFFHKSIGGYHAAKLRRYQDLIDTCISREFGMIRYTNNNRLKLMNTNHQYISDSALYPTLNELTSLNMLNTRYFIWDTAYPPIQNPYALGNAWFVSNTKIVNNADEEIKSLSNFNASTQAIIDKSFKDQLKDFKGEIAPGSKITLTKYEPNKLMYDATGLKSPQLAVFSEIYYDKGWDAYLDGTPVSYLRANYVLRAMVIPSGDHKIEFRFEPRSYYTGNTISLIGSILLLVIVLGGVGWELYRFFRKKEVKPAIQ